MGPTQSVQSAQHHVGDANGDLGTGYSEKQGTGYREMSKIRFIRCFSVLWTDFTQYNLSFQKKEPPALRAGKPSTGTSYSEKSSFPFPTYEIETGIG